MRFLGGWMLSIAVAFGATEPGQDDRPFARQATDLVARLDIRARELRRSAEELEELTFQAENRPVLVFRTHLNMLKEDVTKMGEVVDQLDRNRGQAAPWQVQLTDRILVKVRSITDGITQAIALLEKNHEPTWEPNYQSVVGDIRDQANGLSRTIDAFLRWARQPRRG
jgi:hypothetical protein